MKFTSHPFDIWLVLEVASPGKTGGPVNKMSIKGDLNVFILDARHVLVGTPGT